MKSLLANAERRGLQLLCWCAFLLSFLTLAANAQMRPPAAGFRADRILIKPKPGAGLAQLARLHSASGNRVLKQYPAMGGLQTLQLPRGADVRRTIAHYQQSGLVEFAEPDYWAFLAATPNDPRFADGSLWHLHNTGQSGGVADADIDGPEAWDTFRAASNIVVAIVDTGIRYTHQDLAANMWVNPGEIARNGVDDDGNGLVDDVHGVNAPVNSGNPIDVHGHGTQVAGAAGAVGNNGLGSCGVAWRLKLMACRWMDDAGNGSLSDIIQCIDYARLKGAHVINASFITTSYSSSLYTAVNSCRAAGIIFVAAAGNDAKNNDTTPYYPASFDLDNIVAVAATTRSDALASYSNYGATSVDLAAPGSSIYLTDASGDAAYAISSGTSFAAPVVAGAFALMKGRHPSETYRQLISRVLAATDPVSSLAGKCVTGGRLNVATALGPSVQANFTATPSVGVPPLDVTFADASFGTIVGYNWDFGDGSRSTEQNPIHTYSAEGNYTVILTVTNDSGITSSTNRTISAVANYQISSAAYNWIDPSSMTALTLGNDGVSPAQNLPFSFTFYGQSYSRIFVGANGLLGFDSSGLAAAANTDLPNTSAPNNIICPFWDDLNPGAGGSVRIGITGTSPNRKVVVSWVAVPGAGSPPASFSLQVWLEEGTHRIQFHYQDVQPSSRNRSGGGRSATVGVEHSSGLLAAKHSFNGSVLLADSTAIVFTPPAASPTTTPGMLTVLPATDFVAAGYSSGPFTPASRAYVLTNSGGSTLTWNIGRSQVWLTCSATNGALAPNESLTVDVRFNANANHLAPGSYFDTLQFLNVSTGNGSTSRRVQLTIYPPPALSVISLAPMTLRGQGVAGYTYTLEATSDFVAWTAVSRQVAATDGIFTVSDPSASTFPRRFYRVVVQQ